MTDAAGANTYFTYNIRGFKTTSNDPDTGNWTYTPNSLNELVSQTDNKNQTIAFDYDKLGRLISRLEPESATPTTWTYGTSAALHEIGRLKSLSKPDGYAEAYTFDSIGRPASVTYTEDTTYQINYTYNSIGAVDTVTYPTSTSGYRFALKYLYSYGFPQQVKDNAAGIVFWSLNTTNDYSSPTTELLGNAVTITSGYTPWTNDVTSRQVGSGGSTTNLQNLAYLWDLNGNLQQRQDLAQSLTEVFTHDELNRLKTSTLNSVQNLSVIYDAAGNITTKSDVGSYNYTTNQAGCSYTGLPAQPHAVRNAGGAVYCYDKNGNMTARGGSTISWYSYNQPNSSASGSNSTQFNYNANYQRWKQVAVDTGSTTTTYYVGGILEKVIRPTGVTEYRHAIPAGSGTAIYTRRSNSTNSTYYVTTDHLGSGDLVLGSAGTVLARESFTPFGERRGSNWQGLPSAGDKAVFADVTRRGFTGHEMLDAVNLIHMNGRVYDPHLGRFLSADPIIQTISLSQALNPFSYVMNMPLTLIDPSGYSWLSKLFRSIGNFIKKYWRVIVAVVAAYFVGTWVYQALMKAASTAALAAANAAISATLDATVGAAIYALAMAAASIEAAMVAGMAAGMVAGAITGGVQGALVGAFTGAMFGLANGAWNAAGNGFAQDAGRALTAGALSGGTAEVHGGRFRDGFWLAFASNAANSIYRSVVRYSATSASGGDAVEKGPTDKPVEGANNFGSQGQELSKAGFWGEGGPLSRFANRIPGINAIAGMHDEFVTHMGGAWRSVFNIPTMIPAVAITVPALIAATPAGYLTFTQSRAD